MTRLRVCFASALRAKDGGAEGIRTPDPHNAIVVLYQLSYDPIRAEENVDASGSLSNNWCALNRQANPDLSTNSSDVIRLETVPHPRKPSRPTRIASHNLAIPAAS